MIRVMRYGLLPPTKNGEAVREQMRRARREGNDWVRAEAVGRERSRPMLELCADFSSLKESKDAARKRRDAIASEIKQQHSATRSRSSTEGRRAELKDAERAYKDALAKFSAFQFGKPPEQIRRDPALRAQWESIWGTLKEPAPKLLKGQKREHYKRRAGDANTGVVAQMKREARARHEAYWGTYLCVEAAKLKSFTTTPWYDDDGETRNPRYARKDDRDRVAVQFVGKTTTVEDLFTGTTKARIEVVDAPLVKQTGELRTTRREDQYALLHLRVGHASDPVWATFPMVMHRPLPPGAVVSWIKVTATPIGRNQRWTCEVTCEFEEACPRSGGQGVAAVVFGWHKVQAGLRVAAWMSDSGEVGELTIGEMGLGEVDADGGRGGIASGIRQASKIRSVRDEAFSRALASLLGWLSEHDMPAWMRDCTTRRKYDSRGNVIAQQPPSKKQAVGWLSEWKSQARLASLVKRWAENRVDGDEEIFGRRPRLGADDKPVDGTGAGLEGWRYHDFHLWQYETHQRESALLRRREHYRRFAATFGDKFDTLLIDGSRFDDLRRNPKASDDRGKVKPPASDQFLAAPGELREVIKHAVRGEVRVTDPGGTATTCPKCGHEHAAQKFVDEHAFACLQCDFAGRDLSTVRLLNMLRREGRCEQVDAIIKRQDAIIKRMRSADQAAE